MDLTTDLAAAQQQITQALVATTRSVTSVAAEDVDFHRASDPSIAQDLDRRTHRLLRLTEKLLSLATPGEKYRLHDVDAVESNWRRIIDTGDGLFEQADTCLDEYTGLVKRADHQDAPQSPAPKPSTNRRKKLEYAYRNPVMSKPQLLFEDAPSNYATEPFRPLLTSKPHAIVPLDQSCETSVNNEGAFQYQHPYQREIQEYEYPSWVYGTADPIPYSPFDSSQATFVDDLDGVMAMLEELKGAREIAIDLEHHDTHSYIGIVSLMQISTRDHDWVVDTLKPWRRKLEVLSEVFADPSKIKVMHGAHMDTVWLQRDLGLYVVGLFDTHHASRVLGYPGGSLAYLLKRFADFDAQKQYQTADWRMRPLPADMLEYARSDTHFLLYVYDCMRNELVEASTFKGTEGDRILQVLIRSKDYALQRYEHPFYNNQLGAIRNGWFSALSRFPAHLSQEQLTIFARVHKWRDDVARQEDESTNSILAHHVLVNIARAIPADKSALLGLIHPLSRSVWLRADELTEVIANARATSPQGPNMDEIIAHLPARQHANFSRAREVPDVPSNEKTDQCVDGDCRMHASRFWGATWDQNKAVRSQVNEPYHVILSTSQNIHNTGESNTGAQSDSHLVAGLQNGFASLADTKSDNDSPEPRQILGKRKVNGDADEPEEAEANPTNQQQGGDTATDQAVSKVKRRAERKARKRAKKAQQNGVAQGDVISLETSTPFDYENAPLLLQTPKDHGNVTSGVGKGFNPFAKAADAPQGLPRSQNPRVGKSSTFR